MTRQAHERRLKQKKLNKEAGEFWARNYALLKQIKAEVKTKQELDKIWKRKDDPD